MSRTDGGIDLADRLMPPQAAGMSRYPVAEEIMPGRADFVVERRGFEPMAPGAPFGSRLGPRTSFNAAPL
jgi:hypothetical protein